MFLLTVSAVSGVSAAKEGNSLNVDDFFQPKWWIPEVEGASWHMWGRDLIDLVLEAWDDMGRLDTVRRLDLWILLW